LDSSTTNASKAEVNFASIDPGAGVARQDPKAEG